MKSSDFGASLRMIECVKSSNSTDDLSEKEEGVLFKRYGHVQNLLKLMYNSAKQPKKPSIRVQKKRKKVAFFCQTVWRKKRLHLFFVDCVEKRDSESGIFRRGCCWQIACDLPTAGQ
jgi:hypothetical protein